MARKLKKVNKLTSEEEAIGYFKSFSKDFMTRIRQRIESKSDIMPDQVFPIDDVKAAAVFLVTPRFEELKLGDPRIRAERNKQNRSAPRVSPPAPAPTSRDESLEDLISRMSKMELGDPLYVSAYLKVVQNYPACISFVPQPSRQQRATANSMSRSTEKSQNTYQMGRDPWPTNCCYYCSKKDCELRRCPSVAEDLLAD
ncbi:hypothetical protein FRC15_008615 [Serendipita sp. 397]|nr:hypothetical protein FRC15_008615 [Serendipita sp. 397]